MGFLWAYCMDGSVCKGGVNDKPTTPPPATKPKGQGWRESLEYKGGNDFGPVASTDALYSLLKSVDAEEFKSAMLRQVKYCISQNQYALIGYACDAAVREEAEKMKPQESKQKNGVWSAETQKQIDETLKMGEELVKKVEAHRPMEPMSAPSGFVFYAGKDNRKYILASIETAFLANRGREHKTEYCRCDASVGMVPCEYCAIHIALEQAEEFIKGTMKERPTGPNGEVGLDYADYLLEEIRKIVDSNAVKQIVREKYAKGEVRG